jgi:hypothetical protein
MPWVLPKPSEVGYDLGMKNFWNQVQSTLQIMQNNLGALAHLYKLWMEARASGDWEAERHILDRINQIGGTMPFTPVGTLVGSLPQLLASSSHERAGTAPVNVLQQRAPEYERARNQQREAQRVRDSSREQDARNIMRALQRFYPVPGVDGVVQTAPSSGWEQALPPERYGINAGPGVVDSGWERVFPASRYGIGVGQNPASLELIRLLAQLRRSVEQGTSNAADQDQKK